MSDRTVKWDRRFFEVAKLVSTWSKDRATQVGAVVVLDRHIVSTGYNGFPRGVDDDVDGRHERPQKYLYTEHAERNAVYQASRFGAALAGATMYMHFPTPGPPCCDCSRALIQSGIIRIVCREGSGDPARFRPDWRDSMVASLDMLREAGVALDSLDEQERTT